jgi:hypothetical protein
MLNARVALLTQIGRTSDNDALGMLAQALQTLAAKLTETQAGHATNEKQLACR